MNGFLFLMVFLFGLVIGSFLNVLIYRLPRGISPAHGFSMCPSCEHRLYPIDLIPLFSWIGLKGKCRYCGAPISPRYPAVELANALLWMAAFWRYGFGLPALAMAAVCSCLLCIVFTDWEHMMIPDSFSIVMAGAGVLLLYTTDSPDWLERLIGAVCVSGLFLLIALVSGGRAMGGGDIKMMAALGLCLGWKLTLLTTMLGSVLGSAVLLILHFTRFDRGRKAPFGTFLAVGGIAAILFGNEMILWYLGNL